MKRNNTLKTLALAALMIIMMTPLMAKTINNSTASYLRLGIGAREIAMGEAGSTISRDVASAYWNPAGLAKIKDVEVGAMYNISMNLDRSHQYAAIAVPFRFGTMAFNWINAGVNDIEGYDDTGTPTGIFDDSQHSFSLSYANRWKKLSFGVTPKFFLSTLDDETETGMGVDIGARYDINQYLEAGLMVRDLYSKTAEDKVPMEASFGLAVYPLIGVTLAADLKWEEETPYVAVGAEYWTSIGKDPEADSKLNVISVKERSTWGEMFSYAQTGVRLGFNDGRLSAGTGIRFRNFQIDYVFRLNNHEIMSDDHIVSMILRF
ncbi:MAG: PorV/PorQ family protein [Candidatus Cloacimonetes bacterium]|nr:PorV/PorQ family protein [Candidatus Cloacimonadota bacterium]